MIVTEPAVEAVTTARGCASIVVSLTVILTSASSATTAVKLALIVAPTARFAISSETPNVYPAVMLVTAAMFWPSAAVTTSLTTDVEAAPSVTASVTREANTSVYSPEIAAALVIVTEPAVFAVIALK